MKTYCICSAPTKEELQTMINRYFFSESYIITDDNKVYNTKLNRYYPEEAAIIVERKGRWQFRHIEG